MVGAGRNVMPAQYVFMVGTHGRASRCVDLQTVFYQYSVPYCRGDFCALLCKSSFPRHAFASPGWLLAPCIEALHDQYLRVSTCSQVPRISHNSRMASCANLRCCPEMRPEDSDGDTWCAYACTSARSPAEVRPLPVCWSFPHVSLFCFKTCV